MAKKGESKLVVKNESGKSIEEFLFVVNLSTEIINKSIVDNEYYSSLEAKEELEKYLQLQVESFYRRNKQFLYAETDLLLTDHVKIDKSVIADRFRKAVYLNDTCYKPSMEVNKKDEMINGDEEMDAKFDAALDTFLEKKYGTPTPEYFIIKGDSSLYELFRNEQFIDDLYDAAKKNLKQLSGKENYLNNFQSIEEQLNELQSEIIDLNKKIPVFLKFWRELILNKIKVLLNDLEKEGTSTLSIKFRAFLLNAVFESMELNMPKENMYKFISVMLDSTPSTIKGYLVNWSNESKPDKNIELSDANINEIIETCKLLYGKSGGIGNRNVDKILKNISLWKDKR